METIEEFQERGEFEKSLNASLIVIIPKRKGAMSTRDNKPINLVGSIYKIISKVLSNKRTKVSDEIVSTSQNAFVEGKRILNATLLANEVVDSRRKQGVSDTLSKLDLEKAYDHMNCEFLDLIMLQMGFRVKWRKWIKFCISTIE